MSAMSRQGGSDDPAHEDVMAKIAEIRRRMASGGSLKDLMPTKPESKGEDQKQPGASNAKQSGKANAGEQEEEGSPQKQKKTAAKTPNKSDKKKKKKRKSERSNEGGEEEGAVRALTDDKEPSIDEVRARAAALHQKVYGNSSQNDSSGSLSQEEKQSVLSRAAAVHSKVQRSNSYSRYDMLEKARSIKEKLQREGRDLSRSSASASSAAVVAAGDAVDDDSYARARDVMRRLVGFGEHSSSQRRLVHEGQLMIAGFLGVKDRECFLFDDHFVVTTRSADKYGSPTYRVDKYAAVRELTVDPSDQVVATWPYSFLVCGGSSKLGSRLTLVCHSLEHKQAWLSAFERAGVKMLAAISAAYASKRQRPARLARSYNDPVLTPEDRTQGIEIVRRKFQEHNPNWSAVDDVLDKAKNTRRSLSHSGVVKPHREFAPTTAPSVLRVQESMPGAPIKLAEPGRVLLREGFVWRLDSHSRLQSRYLFLFNDRLVVAKATGDRQNSTQFAMKQTIDLAGRVSLDDESHVYESSFRMETPDRTYTFVCQTDDEKRRWTKLIAGAMEFEASRLTQKSAFQARSEWTTFLIPPVPASAGKKAEEEEKKAEREGDDKAEGKQKKKGKKSPEKKQKKAAKEEAERKKKEEEEAEAERKRKEEEEAAAAAAKAKQGEDDNDAGEEEDDDDDGEDWAAAAADLDDVLGDDNDDNDDSNKNKQDDAVNNDKAAAEKQQEQKKEPENDENDSNMSPGKRAARVAHDDVEVLKVDNNLASTPAKSAANKNPVPSSSGKKKRNKKKKKRGSTRA